MLALAMLSSGLTGPGQTLGVSVFIDHFVEDLSLSRSQVSAAYLVGTLTGALALPQVGKLVDLFGVRRAQMVIGVLFGLVLVNMSAVNNLVWLAVGFIGIRLVGQGSLSLVSTVTVSLKFTDANRGRALGIFSMGSAGLLALVPVALAFVIDRVGWRQAWLVAAAVVSTLVVGIAFFGLRSLPTGLARPANDPTSSGAKFEDTVAELGDTEIAPSGVTEPEAKTSLSRGEAMKTRGFWVLAAVSSTAAMLATALNFHQIDLLGDVGIDETAAAALFIPQVIGSTVSGLAVGYAADRIGTRFLPAIGAGLLVFSHLLAASVSPGLAVFAYAVSLGAAAGAIRTTTSTLLPAWFGTGHLGSIQGALTFFGVGASALGPVSLAFAEDRFGSYRPAVLTLMSIAVVAMFFALTHRSPAPRPAQ